MLHRARETTKTRRRRLEGVIKIDESFHGGRYKWMHSDVRRRRPEKAIVLGMAQRGGRVQTTVIPDRNRETLHREIKSTVAPGSKIFTDDLKSYQGLKPFYTHRTINHDETYVDGEVYTNTIEGFWSHLKRCIRSTYISVDPHHLPKHLNEQQYRWNTRKQTDGDRFIEALKQVVRKRLTYKKLIKRPTSKPRRGGARKTTRAQTGRAA